MIDYIQNSYLLQQVFIGILLLISFRVVRKVVHKWLEKLADNKQVSLQRKQFVIKSFNVASLGLFGAIFTIFLGIGFGDISLFLSSVFAVLGVALFAQWSILSNLTASILIFFVFPYRIGDMIKVAEKDADVSGELIDITMFHVIIRHEDGNIITYPNNLILQKGVTKILNQSGHSIEATDKHSLNN
ncbi:mechanosensitive ion channel family protein [Vibrio sp. DW001]|uniref:mechanosensitive ion channel family protein n=1 Tax=Vibrio sp. DW001 TaxID=2912315 RepID=UPI0023AF92F9|nr:mechanosensitive ion channel family protein [Vibrio sp. DW001]WED28832.1 mechanosensitive ion channel family protein [Vibrio sp. DW001]